MIPVRFTLFRVALTVAVAIAFAIPVEVPGGVSSVGSLTAQAQTRKKTPRKYSRKRRPRGPVKPEFQDDSSRSAGENLSAHMDRFFASNTLLYGSFVAIDAKTGALLSYSEYSRKGTGVKSPGVYTGFPAASVFKIVSTAALLEGGHVEPSVRVCYTGGSHGLDSSNLVDRRKERSCKTLTQAFAASTNAVFGKLAVKYLTADSLVDMARRFGFGKTIQVGAKSSTSKIFRPEGRLSLARMAAGFSGSLMSPLHGAVVAAIIANDGKWPSEVSVGGSGGGMSMEVISRSTALEIGRMMTRVVEQGTGTRHLAGLRTISGHIPAIKTGSLSSRDGTGIWNNWVVGFYPADAPEIAFAAHVGHRGGGALKAGQIARYALETWIRLERARR